MKTALYARVSTIDKNQDPEMQLRDLRRYCEARGWEIAGEYVDHMSGSKDDRPQYQCLLEDARKRKIDCILVWKLDRFGRRTKELIFTIEELCSLGIAFVSFMESLDFTTPMGKLMFHLLSALAEFERNVIRERVVAGMENARAKGKRFGRPEAKIDKEMVLKLRGEGKSIRVIAKEFGVSKNVIHKIVKGKA